MDTSTSQSQPSTGLSHPDTRKQRRKPGSHTVMEIPDHLTAEAATAIACLTTLPVMQSCPSKPQQCLIILQHEVVWQLLGQVAR